MKQFVKISKQFGFNRNRLLYWEFHEGPDGAEDVVSLYFENAPPHVLKGADVQTFRNWYKTESEEAPVTHQYTLYDGLRVVDDLKPIPAPGRGK